MSLSTTESTPQSVDTYFQRMNASADDKAARVIEQLALVEGLPGQPLRVLDYGCGEGSLALRIAAGHGALAGRAADVLAIDQDPEAVSRARGALNRAIASAERPLRMSVQLDSEPGFLQAAAPGTFDAVVMSSVLHEVWSDAFVASSRGSSLEADLVDAHDAAWRAWTSAVQAASRLLRPGGRLVIRDGVKPTSPYTLATARVLDPELAELIDEYGEANPFGYSAKRVDEEDGSPLYASTSHGMAEAVLTCTWGRGSFPRESQERYQLYTLEGCRRMVEQSTWLVQVSAEEYVQQGYVDRLEGRIEIRRWSAEEDSPSEPRPWFPATNAVWAFELQA